MRSDKERELAEFERLEAKYLPERHGVGNGGGEEDGNSIQSTPVDK